MMEIGGSSGFWGTPTGDAIEIFVYVVATIVLSSPLWIYVGWAISLITRDPKTKEQ